MLNQEIVDTFTEQIRKGDYYDAHETIENLWFHKRFEKNSRIKLLKAIINGAVSLELYKRSRMEASKRVWRNFERNMHLIETINLEERAFFEIAIYVLNDVYEDLQ